MASYIISFKGSNSDLFWTGKVWNCMEMFAKVYATEKAAKAGIAKLVKAGEPEGFVTTVEAVRAVKVENAKAKVQELMSEIEAYMDGAGDDLGKLHNIISGLGAAKRDLDFFYKK